jgi:hypothetical protein
MALEALEIGELDAAEEELPALDELMNVITDANAIHKTV